MSNWQPIETAPKDGTYIDICAKAWLPAFDRFEMRRFSDCYWYRGDTMCPSRPHWAWSHGDWPREWRPTHWTPLPELPDPPVSLPVGEHER